MKKGKLSVVGIVFSKDKLQVLLIKRRDVPVWALPGGGVDPGEMPEEAVLREISEETGLLATVKRPVAIYSPISSLANESYTFECGVVSGSLTTGDETSGVGYFPINSLPDSFFFLHRIWLEDALKDYPGTIQRPLYEVTWWNLLKYALRHPVQVVRMGLSRYVIPYNSKAP